MMKTKLLMLILLGQWASLRAQNISIDQITPTEVSGGINVNLLVTTYNGAGYLSHSYEINGNTIDLTVCYWFSLILPVFQMSNDFFIPVDTGGEYVINVQVVHSSSQEICDYYADGPSQTVTFLSNPSFDGTSDTMILYPNPTSGIVDLSLLPTTPNTVIVLDSSGRQVKEIQDLSVGRLDLSDLQNGLYWIRLKSQSGLEQFKVVLLK